MSTGTTALSPPLHDRIEAPIELLVYQDKARIASAPSLYYKDFMAFIRDPANAQQYRPHLIADSRATENTIFRARCVAAARKFGIGFDEARTLVKFLEFLPTPDEAADLVLENYREMAATDQPYAIFANIDEVGRIVVIEGLHRLSLNIAKGASTCPVNVLKRAPQWLDFVAFLRDQGSRLYRDPMATYHKIDHPDFDDAKVIREDRSRPIIKYLRQRYPEGAHGVDIGSMIGFYTHALTKAGFSMTAIEKESEYGDALTTLSELYGLDVDLQRSDIFKFDFTKRSYDFAIALSIIYHLYRNDTQRCRTFIDTLKKSIPVFFIDTESRTGILPEEVLRSMFDGYKFDKILAGRDGRDVFAISRIV